VNIEKKEGTMKILVTFIIFIFSVTVLASDLPSFIKRLDYYDQNAQGEITRISHEKYRYVEGYAYLDLTFPNGKNPNISRPRMNEVLRYFDNKIIPINIDRFIPGYDTSEENKIVILFDNIHDKKYYQNDPNKDYPAFFSKAFSQTYKKKIIIVDVNFATDDRIDLLLNHELMHVFRYMHNKNEEPWLDEGISKLIEYMIAGTDCIQLNNYQKNTNLELKYNYAIPSQVHYAHNLLYLIYLYNNYGGSKLLKKLIVSKKSGIENINSALRETVKDEKSSFKKEYYSFEKTFVNFSLALLLNPYQETVGSEGLLTLDTSGVNRITHFSVLPESIDFKNHYKIKPLASRHYQVDRKCVELAVSENNLVVIAIDLDNSNENEIIRVLASGKICFKVERKSGQFITVINPSNTSVTFQFN